MKTTSHRQILQTYRVHIGEKELLQFVSKLNMKFKERYCQHKEDEFKRLLENGYASDAADWI